MAKRYGWICMFVYFGQEQVLKDSSHNSKNYVIMYHLFILVVTNLYTVFFSFFGTQKEAF